MNYIGYLTSLVAAIATWVTANSTMFPAKYQPCIAAAAVLVGSLVHLHMPSPLGSN